MCTWQCFHLDGRNWQLYPFEARKIRDNKKDFLCVLPWRSVNEAGAKKEMKLIRSQKSIRFCHSLSFTLAWCDYVEGDEGKETHSSLHWFDLAHDLTPSVSAGKFPSLIDLESDTRRQFKVPWENSQEAKGDVIAGGWWWKITENIVVGRRETFVWRSGTGI